MDTVYKLSPSDFAFLYEDCKRCFYRKVKYGIAPPRSPMAGIFHVIDGLMKDAVKSTDLTTFLPDMPKISPLEGWEGKYLTSVPFRVPEYNFGLFILGKLDNISKLEDEDGYAIIDYKTTRLKAEHLDKYKRQLHAYRFCLENPGVDKFDKPSPKMFPITRLGLLGFEPEAFKIKKFENFARLDGKLDWMNIPVDNDGFMDFLGDIADLIAGDMPECGAECNFCNYLSEIEVIFPKMEGREVY